MGGTPVFQVQRAVYTLLTGDSQLSAIARGVFDFAPQNQAFPYVVVGDVTDHAMDTFDKLGRAGVVTVRAWSKATGFGEVISVIERVIVLLDRTSFAGLSGYVSVRTQYQSASTQRESDGITRSVRANFELYVEAV